MAPIVFIGGLGPVELLVIGLLLVIPAVVAIWLYQHARDPHDRVEWHWIVGIVLLFLMGFLPGLVGLWLYVATRRSREPADRPSSSSTTQEWQAGVLLFIAMAVGGFVVTAIFADFSVNPFVTFAAGAVLGFFVISYVLYGR